MTTASAYTFMKVYMDEECFKHLTPSESECKDKVELFAIIQKWTREVIPYVYDLNDPWDILDEDIENEHPNINAGPNSDYLQKQPQLTQSNVIELNLRADRSNGAEDKVFEIPSHPPSGRSRNLWSENDDNRLVRCNCAVCR